jgi:hypothetical protein
MASPTGRVTGTSTGRGCISIGVPSAAKIFEPGILNADPSMRVTPPV